MDGFSERYLEWVKWCREKETRKVKPLTRTQWTFAEFLMLPENEKMVSKIGELENIFANVRQFIKANPREHDTE